jgi:hypothetical protein
LWPRFTSILKEGEERTKKGEEEDGFRLDVVVAASGFGSKEQQELEKVNASLVCGIFTNRCIVHGDEST